MRDKNVTNRKVKDLIHESTTIIPSMELRVLGHHWELYNNYKYNTQPQSKEELKCLLYSVTQLVVIAVLSLILSEI